MLTRLRRRTWGQGLAEVAVVCGIMSSMAGGGMGAAWGVMDMARRTKVISNLKQVYMAISMYADDNDGLPNAEFFPNLSKDKDAVKNSPRSIVRLVGKGLPAEFFINPSAPERFQQAGLTFVWNTAANGKALDQLDGRTWLMMDMNAAAYVLPEAVPRSEGYLVLYSDGSVKYEHTPPLVVKPEDKARLQQQVSQLTGGGGGGGAPAGGGGEQPGAGGGGNGGGEGDQGAVAPKDPDSEVREKEQKARDSNPDEDDAVDD
ncbi:MAG: hypothetical protein HYU66_10325 [Armatimonadetes bacterium]|nr:hypothetical protein [Armatimonadota bacterium]